MSIPKGFSAEQSEINFIVLGDSRPMFLGLPQAPPFKKILEEINLIKPDFAINVGDLVFGYFSWGNEIQREYLDYVNTIKMVKVPYYSVVGNHDVAITPGIKFFKKYLGDLYYSFDYGNSHFIALDSDWGNGGDTGKLGKEQIEWLKKDLETHKNAVNKFIFMHKPMFESESNKTRTSWIGTEERDIVHQLFVQNNVTTVFAGHAHIYRKLIIDNIPYYITGGGGAETSGDEGHEGFHHYLLVNVKDKDINVKLLRPYYLWTNYFPANDGLNRKVTAQVISAANAPIPLEIKGLSFKMPTLKEGEQYVTSLGTNVENIEKNTDGTNTVYVSPFTLVPPVAFREIMISIR